MAVALLKSSLGAHIGARHRRCAPCSRPAYVRHLHVVKCQEQDDVPAAQQPDTAAQWFVEQSEKPAFLAVEALFGLGFLAVLDGGLSGDWLKYGLIDEQTQRTLTIVAIVGCVFHAGYAVYCARDSIQHPPEGQQSTTAPQIAVAAVRGDRKSVV